jgi:hypothetical protein
MKKLIISESEKKRILEMYNLITEDVDQELLDYGNSYIDNNSCDEIYNDLVKFQSAVNSGQVQMSSEDKKELDDNLDQMKTFKSLACGKIKKEMKKSFAEQSQSSPEKLKDSMCWFASNISKPQTPLKACQTSTEAPAQTGTEQPAEIGTEQPAETGTEQPAQTGSEQTTTVDSDYKLDTPQKIGEFQTWMDKNHGKWAYSKKYNRNYSVDRSPKKGYGNMGPNTKKAWDNTEYKNAYLKEMGLLKQETNKTENKSEIKQVLEPKNTEVGTGFDY